MAKNVRKESIVRQPLLMSAAQMAKVSGIGENTLRRLMLENEIEYLQIGSHRLLAECAIWDYYERKKSKVVCKTNVTSHDQMECGMQGKVHLAKRGA